MHFVVNMSTKAILNPWNEGFYKDARPKSYGVFDDVDEAKKFAEFCAKKHQESEFGVASVGPRVKAVTAPVEWTS